MYCEDSDALYKGIRASLSRIQKRSLVMFNLHMQNDMISLELVIINTTTKYIGPLLVESE